jgi:Na+/H+ antiporter NhaD/arsenite permease-like protein
MLPQAVSSLIFVFALALILSERLDRTIVAMSGAAAMVTAGMALGFYDAEQAVASIDFETLGLLFGMMILLAVLQPTGLFEYLASAAARASRGKPLPLLILLGSVTTILSMLLDNVTTVVLIAPLTILVAEILGISPLPFLVAEALLSDTGGVATLIGDPPNVLIGSAAGLSFNDFLTHALPVVALAWPAALALLLWLFRKELAHKPLDPQALASLNTPDAMRDWRAARKVLIALGVALLLFLAQDVLGLDSAFIAMTAASLALIWIRPPISQTLRLVEWPVLVFFGGLFVMVGGLQAAGVMDGLARAVVGGGSWHPVLTAVVLIWLVAGLSAVIDNVPITVALIPIIQEMGRNGVNVSPLWWALAFGAGFGGNGTIIGSTANIVVAQLSLRTRDPITSRLWMRRGLPVMIVTCVISSLAMAIGYPWFSR